MASILASDYNGISTKLETLRAKVGGAWSTVTTYGSGAQPTVTAGSTTITAKNVNALIEAYNDFATLWIGSVTCAATTNCSTRASATYQSTTSCSTRVSATYQSTTNCASRVTATYQSTTNCASRVTATYASTLGDCSSRVAAAHGATAGDCSSRASGTYASTLGNCSTHASATNSITSGSWSSHCNSYCTGVSKGAPYSSRNDSYHTGNGGYYAGG